MKRLLAAGVVLLSMLGSTAVPADATTSATTSAGRCMPPGHVRFVGTPHRASGVVTWQRPQALPADAGGYRVFRNGRVVGQTRLSVRRMRVSFHPGRVLVLQVRVALRSGRLATCGARVNLKPAWHAPSAPGDLVAQPGDDSVSLSWQPAAPGDGVLNGYRLFVDGRVSRQLRATTAKLSLSPLHPHQIAVAAVDTQGAESPQSNTVSVTPGHTAPTVPGAPVADQAGPGSIRLAWSPSTAFGGARLSYRVLRNGKVVGQVSSTAYIVGNLAPVTAYTFTVVAVDSLGYSSRESAPAQATTASPTKSTGSVHAFLLASTGSSFVDLQQHYQQVGTVYPTYYDCLANGTFVGRDDPLVTGWARLRGIRVEARFNCQSTATLHALLANSWARTNLIQQLVDQSNASGWDGINLDLEAGAAADRPLLTAFVTEAATALHAAGKTLSVDVSAKVKDVLNHPRSTFFDYDGLAAQADTVFVMCWGIHWRTSAPGAIDDWTWATQVASYLAARPNRAKFVLGFGMYGFDWPSGGGVGHPATPLEWGDVQTLLAQTGQQTTYDAAQRAPHFSYTDQGGIPHAVWFTDAQSLGERIALAHSTGVGIGLWRLGDEDPAVWSNPLIAAGAPW